MMAQFSIENAIDYNGIMRSKMIRSVLHQKSHQIYRSKKENVSATTNKCSNEIVKTV